MSWLDELKYDEISPLLASGNPAVGYWTRKTLLDEEVPTPKDVLWDLKIPKSILRRQNGDRSWKYPVQKTTGSMDYDQLETYRQLGFLVEMFGFTKEHPAIEQTAEYIFSCQSSEGDMRGVYANQYSPNYTAALLELLIKAGYDDDGRVLKGLAWLESVQQDDGGWALAFRTQRRNLDVIYDNCQRLELNRTMPASHFVTGVVLRAYAAHPLYCDSETAKRATRFLVSRLFEKDVYPDRNRKDDWTRFSFPFWQTDILSSLDIVGKIEPSLAGHEKVLEARQWFADHQQPNGLFTGHLLKDRYHDLPLWYSLAICRALKRLG